MWHGFFVFLSVVSFVDWYLFDFPVMNLTSPGCSRPGFHQIYHVPLPAWDREMHFLDGHVWIWWVSGSLQCRGEVCFRENIFTNQDMLNEKQSLCNLTNRNYINICKSHLQIGCHASLFWLVLVHHSSIWVSSHPKQKFFLEEYAQSRMTQCGTVCLEHSGSDLATRVANTVFELARSGKMEIPGFPNYAPIVEALKAGQPTQRSSNLKVTAQRGNKLMILESFTKKWTSNDETKDRCLELIKEHNEKFNPGENSTSLLEDRTQC